MKFKIKTSAVAVSDDKCVYAGTYETENKKEIARLEAISKTHPKDVSIIKESKPTPQQNKTPKGNKKPKEEKKPEEKTPEQKTPEENKPAENKPNAKK